MPMRRQERQMKNFRDLPLKLSLELISLWQYKIVTWMIKNHNVFSSQKMMVHFSELSEHCPASLGTIVQS